VPSGCQHRQGQATEIVAVSVARNMAEHMPNAITITGTRSTDHRAQPYYAELFAEYVAPFATPDVRFYLGGAVGIDSLALVWLAVESNAELVVVVPGTFAGQPADARQAVSLAREHDRLAGLVELDHPHHPSRDAYFARNRWMVDRSDFVIAFPRDAWPPSSGTWYTANYGADQNKPRLIVPV
jgi:predicted Rossmann fold nucleotide-binding protein DprA/Smf involved in DNA uptake